MAISAIIEGTGLALPKQRVTNEQVVRRLQRNSTTEAAREKLDPDWIFSNIGIRVRHKASRSETNASLGASAALSALQDANMSLEEIDYIIGSTSTPDDFTPSFASTVHEQLLSVQKGGDIPASDKNAACSGTIYALVEACAYIKAGMYKTILIVGCDRVFSKHIDWKHPTMGPATAQLFGDGACALVVRGYADSKYSFGIKDFILSGRGNTEDLAGRRGKVHMHGGKVFKFAVTEGRRLLREAMIRQGLTVQNVTWFLLHQANKRINDAILGEQGIGAKENQCPSTIDIFGNTAGSSLGMLIAHNAKNFKRGEKIMLFAAGAGLTSAVMYMVWGKGIHAT